MLDNVRWKIWGIAQTGDCLFWNFGRSALLLFLSTGWKLAGALSFGATDGFCFSLTQFWVVFGRYLNMTFFLFFSLNTCISKAVERILTSKDLQAPINMSPIAAPAFGRKPWQVCGAPWAVTQKGKQQTIANWQTLEENNPCQCKIKTNWAPCRTGQLHLFLQCSDSSAQSIDGLNIVLQQGEELETLQTCVHSCWPHNCKAPAIALNNFHRIPKCSCPGN